MPRWEPNARLRLVESALELFEHEGYDATSVADIAARAGLTKTTFFRHFPDKREVLFAGQEDHRALLESAAAAAPADATPLEVVAAALDALAETFPDDRRAFVARVTAVVDGHSELRERAALKRAGYAEALADALRRRSAPAPAATVAAQLGVLALYEGLAAWSAGAGDGSPARRIHASLQELHRAGLALR